MDQMTFYVGIYIIGVIVTPIVLGIAATVKSNGVDDLDDDAVIALSIATVLWPLLVFLFGAGFVILTPYFIYIGTYKLGKCIGNWFKERKEAKLYENSKETVNY